ncbi:unnamed protein product, partial [Eruca vesicaria subsp. sativa]|nr:unnamed protein product [Eruca vesicaria subsp. sativa]
MGSDALVPLSLSLSLSQISTGKVDKNSQQATDWSIASLSASSPCASGFECDPDTASAASSSLLASFHIILLPWFQGFAVSVFAVVQEWTERNDDCSLLEAIYVSLDEVPKLAEFEIYVYNPNPNPNADPFLEGE